jgi:hypothetical protein
MERTITKPAIAHSGTGTSAQLFEDWFDPIESAVRDQVRHFIEGLIEAELEEVLARPRYRHQAKAGAVPLPVECEKCGRRGLYHIARLIEGCGIDAKLSDWADELTFATGVGRWACSRRLRPVKATTVHLFGLRRT